MSRKLPLPLSLLPCVALSLLSCEKGGAFDPLDNLPTGSTQNPMPTPTAELPKCDDTAPKLPCKIDISDLSFDVVTCTNIGVAGKDGMGAGMTWHNPNGALDKLQFGSDENNTLVMPSCGQAPKECTIKLKALPAAWNTVPATARVRLSYSQKYKLGDELLFAGSNIDNTRLTFGVPQVAGRDLLTFTGARRDGGNLEQHTTSLWVSLSTDRALSFTVRTFCYKTLFANAYWYIEKMTAEALP